MILEAIVSSFFSGLGSTVFQELTKQAQKKNEAHLRVLIRQELEAFARSSRSTSLVIDDPIVNAIVLRLKMGEILAYPDFPAWQSDAAIYKITSVVSEKVLDVWGASQENGTPIKQCASHGGANQRWRLIPVSSAGQTFKILSELSGKVLDVWGASRENGTLITQYASHGGANQHWHLIPITSTNETFKILSELSGKVLDVWGANTEHGAQIVQDDYHGGTN